MAGEVLAPSALVRTAAVQHLARLWCTSNAKDRAINEDLHWEDSAHERPSREERQLLAKKAKAAKQTGRSRAERAEAEIELLRSTNAALLKRLAELASGPVTAEAVGGQHSSQEHVRASRFSAAGSASPFSPVPASPTPNAPTPSSAESAGSGSDDDDAPSPVKGQRALKQRRRKARSPSSSDGEDLNGSPPSPPRRFPKRARVRVDKYVPAEEPRSNST